MKTASTSLIGGLATVGGRLMALDNPEAAAQYYQDSADARFISGCMSVLLSNAQFSSRRSSGSSGSTSGRGTGSGSGDSCSSGSSRSRSSSSSGSSEVYDNPGSPEEDVDGKELWLRQRFWDYTVSIVQQVGTANE